MARLWPVGMCLGLLNWIDIGPLYPYLYPFEPPCLDRWSHHDVDLLALNPTKSR